MASIGFVAEERLHARIDTCGSDISSRAIVLGALCWVSGSEEVESLVDQLIDQLSREIILARDVRKRAVRALGDLGHPKGVELLLNTASADTNKGVRDDAFKTLIMLGVLAVEPLILALSSSSADTRKGVAAAALGAIGDRRAVEPLIAALPNSMAIAALGKIGDARAAGPLLAARPTSNVINPGVVETALRKISDANDTKDLWSSLGDKRTFERLIAALDETDQNVRWEAAEALCQVKYPFTVECLYGALNNRQHIMHDGAVQALVSIGTLVVPLLCDSIYNGDGSVNLHILPVLVPYHPTLITSCVESHRLPNPIRSEPE